VFAVLAVGALGVILGPHSINWAQERPTHTTALQTAATVSVSGAYEKGVALYRQGEFAQALPVLRQAQADHPKNPNIRYYLALCLDKLVRYHEAITQYQYVTEHGEDPQVVDYAHYRLKTLQERMNPKGLESSTSSAGEPKSVALLNTGLKNDTPDTPARLLNGKRSVTLPREVSIVPLKKNTQALMLEATLNNQAIGTFILDTGATYTSISREMAEALNLDLENAPKVRITTANGRIEVPKVVIEKLNVNGLEAHNVEATVIDIRKGSSFSGLLGLSFIKKFKLTIDPQAGQLIFQEADPVAVANP
jgi:clan AA aspartic protease (TIGR02281 family)